MAKIRKVPLRICIGCRETRPKKELVRVVRTPQGEVLLDLTGKKSGRGAYLCPRSSCLQKAVKGKRLEKNLQHPVANAVIEEISGLLAEKEKDGAGYFATD